MDEAQRIGVSSEHNGTLQDAMSVQAPSKHSDSKKGAGRYAKSDIRYWQGAVFQPTYTRNGAVHTLSDWAAKIQFAGRRETFSLSTANRTAAAAKAKAIYLSLLASGWEATVAMFKPKTNAATKSADTIGEFIEQSTASAGGRSKTVEGYARALRTIVASVFTIEGGVERFDSRPGGGREKWIAKIHAVKLADLTPDKIQKWKIAFLRRAGSDPIKRRAAMISVNSLMRQAKSLFAPDKLKFIRLNIAGTPFDGVRFEARQSMRYRSNFDVERIIADAQEELPQEQLKILLLAVMAGLRRNEIDKLEYPAFRWTQNVIRIETTKYLQPKSEDSIGDVEVDPELMVVFRGFKARATGSFVIESKVAPRMSATYSHYRCERDFSELTAWLRAHGVDSDRPLHTLRKEYGSQMCAKHGIYAASQALRHADIAITGAHYLDQRKRSTVGLGSLLKGPANVTPMPCQEATSIAAGSKMRRSRKLVKAILSSGLTA